MNKKYNTKIKECTDLANDILDDFELSRIPARQIILKCLRLCRLMDNEEGVQLFTFEANGYSKDLVKHTLSKEGWELSKITGRHYNYHDKEEGREKEGVYTDTVDVMIASIEALKIELAAAKDPSISINSANPSQYLRIPQNNQNERISISKKIEMETRVIDTVLSNIYDYILDIRNQLVYGNSVESIFENYRKRVDDSLSRMCPQAIKQFISIYDNLLSGNSTDWENALTTCRKLLKDVADVLYPATSSIEKNGKTIKLDEDSYINRLIQFIESKSNSKVFKSIVGSNLKYIGDRLDSLNCAANKGVHHTVTKEEANRCVIYTYLFLGDILSL